MFTDEGFNAETQVFRIKSHFPLNFYCLPRVAEYLSHFQYVLSFIYLGWTVIATDLCSLYHQTHTIPERVDRQADRQAVCLLQSPCGVGLRDIYSRTKGSVLEQWSVHETPRLLQVLLFPWSPSLGSVWSPIVFVIGPYRESIWMPPAKYSVWKGSVESVLGVR